MPPRTKIAHLIVSLERGGAEMALLRMLPLLNEDFEHLIVTLRGKGPLAPEFEAKGIRVISLNQVNLFDIPSYIRLKHILRSLAPDLVLTNLLHADLVGRLFVQFTTHCPVISSLVTTYNSRQYWIARLFERMTKRLATGYVANAESVKLAYIRDFGVRPERIHVMPCGIDIALFQDTPINHSVEADLGLLGEDFVVICVANLHQNKGHRFLLEAFEEFYRQHPDTKLLLVGEGPEKNTLLSQIKQYHSKSSIFFLGRRNDVPSLLKLADVFVLPTFFEGMSNALMEAMASGLLVITSDIPENRELIEPGRNGLFCPVGDAHSIAKALEESFKNHNLREALARNGLLFINEHYALAQAITRWKLTYSLLLQKS